MCFADSGLARGMPKLTVVFFAWGRSLRRNDERLRVTGLRCPEAAARPLARKLVFNCRFNRVSFADRRLFFLSRSCHGDTGFSGRLMPAGHLLSWAGKKASKEPAGNAITRSRLPSERKIAHSRINSLCPYFDSKAEAGSTF